MTINVEVYDGVPFTFCKHSNHTIMDDLLCGYASARGLCNSLFICFSRFAYICIIYGCACIPTRSLGQAAEKLSAFKYQNYAYIYIQILSVSC